MTSPCFCAGPWVQLQVHPGGEMDTCAQASEPMLADDGTPALLSRHSVQEIWNGAVFVAMRREMAEGRWPDRCSHCRQSEERTGISTRMTYNRELLAPLGLAEDDLLRRSAAEGHRVAAPPRSLFLNMGALCNLACRMCSPLVSTAVAADPVLSRWRTTDARHRWRGTAFSLGPHPVGGVAVSGLLAGDGGGEGKAAGRCPAPARDSSLDPVPLVRFSLRGLLAKFRRAVWGVSSSVLSGAKPNTMATRSHPADDSVDPLPGAVWSDGDAHFRVPWSGLETLDAVEIDIAAPPARWPGRPVEATLNGRRLGRHWSRGGTQTLRWTAPADLAPGPLDVGIRSDCRHGRGVGLVGIRLIRPQRAAIPGGHSGDFFGRFAQNVDWQDAPGLRAELIPVPSDLRMLKLTGGEPMIQPRVAQLLDGLIDAGAAPGIALMIFTNGAAVSPAMLARVKRFRQVTVKLSLDGVGAALEYIRWPARWPRVLETLDTWQAAGDVHIVAHPTIQAYSLPALLPLLHFCADRAIDISLRSPLQHPAELAHAVLPPAFRRHVAQQLGAYLATDCPERFRRGVGRTIAELGIHPDDWDPAAVARFVDFTRQLDHSRSQSFARTFPEVVQAFADAGRPWPGD